MSRPWVLVFLLLMIVLTSQFEWKQQFGNAVEQKRISSSKEHIDRREEVVKEKERNIQKLEENVRTLRCSSAEEITRMAPACRLTRF